MKHVARNSRTSTTGHRRGGSVRHPIGKFQKGGFLKTLESGKFGQAAGVSSAVVETLFGDTVAGSGASGLLGGAAAGSSFGLPGVIIGGLLGLGSGIFLGNKRKNAEEEAQQRRDAQNKQMQTSIRASSDLAALKVFPTEGIETSAFGFLDGGPTPGNFRTLAGGRLFPLGSGVFLAKGKKHLAGGIQGDTNNDGRADIEIEDGELFFDQTGRGGFIVNKDIAKPFIPKFKRLGNTRIDRITRKRLISQAIDVNEKRRTLKFEESGNNNFNFRS